MKRIWFFLLLLPFLLPACSDSSQHLEVDSDADHGEAQTTPSAEQSSLDEFGCAVDED